MPRRPRLQARKLPSGRWQVDVAPSIAPDGKRIKIEFATEGMAKTYIKGLNDFRAQPIPDTMEQRREAYLLRKRLPEGKDLTDAVELALAAWHLASTGQTFAAVLDQVLAAKQGVGLSGRHPRDMGQKARRFKECFGARPIASIERAEIRQWLTELRAVDDSELSSTSRNGYRRAINIVFNFALKEGYLSANPVVAVAATKVIRAPVEIYSPAEARALLFAAKAHRYDETGRETELSSILPAVAMGFFGGLRPEETYRLSWSDVDWEHCQIEVAADRTKTAKHRYAPIPPILLAWLEPYRQAEGRVCPVSLWRTLGKVRRKAQINRWPQDVLRHSFASYTLALRPDVHQLAAEMGNSVAVIHRDYRRPVRQEDAQEFFALRPEQRATTPADDQPITP